MDNGPGFETVGPVLFNKGILHTNPYNLNW